MRLPGWVLDLRTPENTLISVLAFGDSSTRVAAPFDDTGFQVQAIKPVTNVRIVDAWREHGLIRCVWE